MARGFYRKTEPERVISFAEFRQAIRRHRPSELLPALAGMAAHDAYEPVDIQLARYIPPWGIALIARESILWGNELRDDPVDEAALIRLFNARTNLRTPGLGSLDIESHLTRMAYEQFPYQESIFEEMSRTHALLVDGPKHVETEAVSEAAWTELLGGPLDEVVGTTFLLMVGAKENRGWFDASWVGQSQFSEIAGLWPDDLILRRLEDLSSTREDFKAAYAAAPQPVDAIEYSYNPLTARPFLKVREGVYLAPQPRLILRTITPGGLYYPAIHKWGEPFARDMGHLVEWYVGEQLRLIPGAQIFPEISYGKGGGQKSVDWFLVLPNLVVMLETKSARMGLLQRAAEGHIDAIDTVIGKAKTQLGRSDKLIEEGHEAFAHIPSDRPRIGLVITAEPFYLGNSEGAKQRLEGVAIPTMTASLRELERLVTISPADIEKRLVEVVSDEERSTWMLSQALNDVAHGKQNQVLSRAWDSYWPDGMGDPLASGALQMPRTEASSAR